MKKPTLFNSSRRKPKSLDQSLGPLVSRYLLPPGTPKWVVRVMLRNSGPLGLLMGPTLLIFLSVLSLAQFKVRGERGSQGASKSVVSFADEAHWRRGPSFRSRTPSWSAPSTPTTPCWRLLNRVGFLGCWASCPELVHGSTMTSRPPPATPYWPRYAQF